MTSSLWPSIPENEVLLLSSFDQGHLYPVQRKRNTGVHITLLCFQEQPWKVSFPRADFLPSGTSKLGLGFWLVLHLPYSPPGPYGMHIGGAWFQSQGDQSKGEVLWRFSRHLGASWDRTVSRRAADSNNACDRRKNREKMTSPWVFHTEEGQNWSWVGWLQSFA